MEEFSLSQIQRSNPRRHSGKPTLQEARHNQKAIEAMKDSGLQKIHNIGPAQPSW